MNNQTMENGKYENLQKELQTIKSKNKVKTLLIIFVTAIGVLFIVFTVGYFSMMPSVDDIVGLWHSEAYSSFYESNTMWQLVFDDRNSAIMASALTSSSEILAEDGSYEIKGYKIVIHSNSSGSSYVFTYNPFNKTVSDGEITYTRKLLTLKGK